MENINNLTKDNKMNTDIEILNATAEKVVNFLKQIYPDYVAFDDYTFTIKRGSTQVMVQVRPYTEDDTVVEFVSNVVYQTNVTPNLMYYLLRKNTELHFGAFGLLFDDTVIFSYSIAGKNLDENEFRTALNSVAIIADYYDDEIVEKFGGKRAHEVSAEIE